MRKALTDKTVAALKTNKKSHEFRDMLLPGFGVRVYKSGRKAFTLCYRYGTSQRRVHLGNYPIIKLADARKKATEILRLVGEGIDPLKTRRKSIVSTREAVDSFILQYAKPRNKNWRETSNVLNRELVSRYAERDIKQIDRQDILEILDAAIERGASYQANRIHSMIRKLFNWLTERGIVDRSPIIGLRKPTKEYSRDRVLTDDEIVSVIKACQAEAFPFGQYTLMLLATAQRRSEVANMKWSQIDREKRIWEIPSELSKNGKPHQVPLNDFAMKLLDQIPVFTDCDFVFSTTGYSPISGISKMLKRIQAYSGTCEWRLHDLRRTAASGMARAGISPHVVEKVLNHVSGVFASSVTSIYIRYGYDTEKREALNRWGEFLESLRSDGIDK